MPSFCISSLVLFFIFYLFSTFPEASHSDGSSLSSILQYHSQCVFSRMILAGAFLFFIPTLSQTLIAPVLIKFLKSLRSFKVILDIALVTSSFSYFSRNAFADRSDGTEFFWGVFSNSFCRFVISLLLLLSITPVSSK